MIPTSGLTIMNENSKRQRRRKLQRRRRRKLQSLRRWRGFVMIHAKAVVTKAVMPWLEVGRIAVRPPERRAGAGEKNAAMTVKNSWMRQSQSKIRP